MYGITVLSSYAIIMLLATLLLTKRETVAEKFYVGDRHMGTLQSAMSIAATWIWAPALFVSAEKAYANGFVGLFWFLVPNILCLLLFIPFARKIRERMPHGISLAGFMGEQYQSAKVKGIYLFQLGSLSVLSTGVQLLAGGKILSTITGIPMFAMTVILAAIAYSYSQFSGIKASVMTDAVQMLIMLAVCAILIPWALSMPGNIQALARGITGVTGDFTSLFSESGMQILLGFGIPTAIGLFAGPFGDQCFWQRAFSIQENKIRRAFALGALLFAIVPLSMGLLGFVAAGKGFTPNDSGIVNFELVAQLFPRWVMVPFLFMVISGLLSTVDSNLCAISSLSAELTTVANSSNAGKMKAAKLSMLGTLAAGILIANIPGVTVTHLFLFYGRVTPSLRKALNIRRLPRSWVYPKARLKAGRHATGKKEKLRPKKLQPRRKKLQPRTQPGILSKAVEDSLGMSTQLAIRVAQLPLETRTISFMVDTLQSYLTRWTKLSSPS